MRTLFAILLAATLSPAAAQDGVKGPPRKAKPPLGQAERPAAQQAASPAAPAKPAAAPPARKSDAGLKAAVARRQAAEKKAAATKK